MNPRILTLMILAVLGGSLSYCNEFAKPCDPEKCLPPNCRCSGDNRPPGGLMPKNTPQTIVVSFDDDVEKQYMDLHDQLFDGVRNPNNCPAEGTLFVSHNYANYYLVEDAYSRGYEIADHTVTLRSRRLIGNTRISLFGRAKFVGNGRFCTGESGIW